MDNNNHVAVITGASAGIGAALAKRLGADGCSVVLAARREKELREIATQISADTLVIACDVTRRDEVERLKTEALKRFGAVDIWVNNAGRGIGRKVLDLTDDDFDAMMLVNVKSALYGMQVIIPHFKERGNGHLINISSFLSRIPFATYRSAYSAAKAALNTLTANLRMDLRAEYPEIHVSLVLPGVVATEFAKNAMGGTPQMPRPSGAMNAQTAEEVADTVVNLVHNPQAEIYTNPASPDLFRRYYGNVDEFETAMLHRT
jgi:short-subunit dehydrogenase